jgi:hypothetical protein
MLFAQVEPLDEPLRAARALYEAEKWPKGSSKDGFSLGTLVVEGWKGGELRSDSGRLQRRFTATSREGKEQTILIEALVSDTVEKSHEQLLIWLAGRQAPDLAPRGQDRDMKVGDVAYLGLAGAQGQTIAWIAFVRGNIAMRVKNLDPKSQADVDLARVARAIDENISSSTALAPGAKPRYPTITRFTCEKERAVAGEQLRLDVAISDPAGGTPHLRWVVGGPGQGYIEAKDGGAWYLHTTGPGQISLGLEVTGSTGTFVAKRIQLTVDEEKK